MEESSRIHIRTYLQKCECTHKMVTCEGIPTHEHTYIHTYIHTHIHCTYIIPTHTCIIPSTHNVLGTGNRSDMWIISLRLHLVLIIKNTTGVIWND